MDASYLVFITLWISAAVTASYADKELMLTDDTDTRITNEAIDDEAMNADILGTDEGKRLYQTFSGLSKMDKQSVEDIRELIETLSLDSSTNSLKARTLLQEKRALDTVKTITGMLKANAEKLDKLTDLVETRLDRLDHAAEPLFISLFLMLADISLAASPRLALHKEEMGNIFNYFQRHIGLDMNEITLDSQFLPIYQWYTGSFEGLAPYSSCLDYLRAGYTKDGVYMIRIPTTNEELDVYCDQTTDNGGWLVIQRREDGSEDFFRGWEEYKQGFGEISKEFWLGNEVIHELTTTAQELRVDLSDFSGNTAYAKYQSFSIGSEAEKYKLSFNGYSGTAGDSLNYHNGRYFSTKDRDNDPDIRHCAQARKGAWWYTACDYSNLNGIYYDSAKSDSTGVIWYHWKNKRVSLKKSEMKIRPKQ